MNTKAHISDKDNNPTSNPLKMENLEVVHYDNQGDISKIEYFKKNPEPTKDDSVSV